MPTDVEKLASLRVSRQSSNLDVKPLDLFRAAAHTLDSGEETYDSAIILARRKMPDGSFEIYTWRCGLSRDSETALMVIAQDLNIRKQRGR